MRNLKNSRVEALVCIEGQPKSYREPQDISVEEWRETFESHKSFAYPSTTQRLLDLDAIVSTGLTIFNGLYAWEECIILADWALGDADFLQAANGTFALAHFYRAQGLIRTGQIDEALDTYLTQAKEVVKTQPQWRKSLCFTIGKQVVIDLRLEAKKKHPHGRKATPEAVSFVRELWRIHHPKRSIPTSLRENGISRPAWAEMRKALNLYGWKSGLGR